MPYCKNCGHELQGEVKFCPDCGASTSVEPSIPPRPPAQSTPAQPHVLKTLSTMELIAAIVWTVIAVLQAISAASTINLLLSVDGYANMFGLDGLLGGSWVTAISLLAVAGWNGFAAYRTFNFSALLKKNPPVDTVSRYEKSLVSLIIILVVMVFVSLIGVLGAIYSLVIRGYAINHKEEIEQEIAISQGAACR